MNSTITFARHFARLVWLLRVTGHDVPYPPAKLEKHHLPDLDRLLYGVDQVLDRAGVNA